MINRLKQMYKDQIIFDITSFNNEKYYYFYTGNNDEIFGIEKTIGLDEYSLIRHSLVEYKTYDTKKNQKIYEYLFNNHAYPFKKAVQLLIIEPASLDKQSIEIINDLFNSFYNKIEPINLDNIIVMFAEEKFDIDIKHILTPFSVDTGINLKVHEGIYINSSINGGSILGYVSLIKQYMNENSEIYSDVSSPVFSNIKNQYQKYIYQNVLTNLFKDGLMKDLILTYFKNDLNVLQTSKDLYLNRNSLLNKIDSFYKKSGFKLQSFSHCAAIYSIIKENK